MNITLGSSRIGDIFEGLIYDDKQSSRLWRREAITSRSISCQIPYEWNCCQQLPNASLSFSSSTHSITSCQCPSLWLTVLYGPTHVTSMFDVTITHRRIKSFTICTFLHWAAAWNENCSTFIHWIWGFSSLFQKPVVKIGILVPKAKAILSWIFWATLFNLDILNDFLELDRDKMAFQSSNTTYYKGHKTLPISVKQLVYISIRQCATRL